MKTKIYDKNKLRKIANVILDGGIVAVPTETVYGLAIIFDSLIAYNRLMEVKKRPPNKPFSLMFSNIKEVEQYCVVNPKIRRLMETVFPAPLTLILKRNKSIEVDFNSEYPFDTIGVRIPNDPFMLELLKVVEKPIFVPSANPASLPPATTIAELLQYFDGAIDVIVNSSCINNKPSTIIDLTEPTPKIVREGLFSIEKFKQIWGEF